MSHMEIVLKARDVPTKRDRLQPDEEVWPRLSESLTGPKHPEFCQKCGRSHLEIDAMNGSLQAWQECGQDGKLDPKETIFVMICSLCNKEGRGMVARHKRFYHDLPRNAPLLGIMDLCVECAWRDGTHCANRSEKRIEFSQPITAHISCRPRSRSGMYSYYPNPPRSCSGREQIDVPTDVENTPLAKTHRFAHDLEEAQEALV